MTRTTPRPSVTLLLAALLLGAPQLVRADGDPATNDVLQVVPYQGQLEKDGEPVSGDVKMYFHLYDGPGDTEVWHEVQLAQIFAGRFVVLLGLCHYEPNDPRCPELTEFPGPISSVIGNADDLYLAIDLEVGGVSVTMQHRKRFLPVPYAMLSTSHPILLVDDDLTVGGDATVSGAVNADGDLNVTGATTLTGATTVAGSLTVNSATTINNALTVNGTLRVSCPTGMSHVGAWCIDNVHGPVVTWNTALLNCHNAGKDICSYSALMACDVISNGSECVAATDSAARTLWTSDRHGERDDFDEAWENNVMCFKGDNNEVDECATSEAHDYFCCIPGQHH